MSPVVVALRPVLCVIDHLHRDVAVADDARQGRFSHGGVSLGLGRRPDWRNGGLDRDEEWRIEWVKLYEGLDLAHAYGITGDAEYLRTWEDLVESFCDQVPVGFDPSEVSARRIQNWLYAWQRFAAAQSFDGLRPGLAERLVARLRDDVEHLAAHLTSERNHRTLELYTLLLAALALDDRPDSERALALLAENAATDIWSDGVHRECSTDYHCLVLRSLLGAIANARLAGLGVPDGLVARVELACDVALYLQRPDGVTPALSDGDPGRYAELLLLGAQELDRPDLAWAATGGRLGRPPATRSKVFPIGGYVVQRSGWGEGPVAYTHERFAVFDVGPLGDGGHGHYDQLSVELYGAGRPLVVDPGRFTYAEDAEGWRRWFKGTAAHNTVTVDGLDQTPYRRGKPKGPQSSATLVGCWTAAGLDVAIGRVTSPCHDAVHTRTLTLVDGDYWVVHDQLRSPSAHRYQARWHLTAEAAGHTVVHQVGRGLTVIDAPGITIEVAADSGAVHVEEGWVSPSYGVKASAPVVVVTRHGHDVDIRTVLRPRSAPW